MSRWSAGGQSVDKHVRVASLPGGKACVVGARSKLLDDFAFGQGLLQFGDAIVRKLGATSQLESFQLLEGRQVIKPGVRDLVALNAEATQFKVLSKTGEQSSSPPGQPESPAAEDEEEAPF